MPNPYGYAKNKRQELTISKTRNKKSYRDPKDDFPYNTRNMSPAYCMNTVAGRAHYRLFTDNLFVTAISFHGSGLYPAAIAYPWNGKKYEVTKENPDFQAFKNLGSVMQEESGDGDNADEKYYTLGNVAETTYPMDASLTDWAYAASWDDSTLSACKPQTLPELPSDFFTKTTTENIATAIFRVETYYNENEDGE